MSSLHIKKVSKTGYNFRFSLLRLDKEIFVKNYLHLFVLPINLSKTLLYSSEYRLLYGISNSLRYFVKPPTGRVDSKIVNKLKKEVIDIHKQDAENVANGIYPFEVVRPRNPVKHVKLLPKLIIDSLKISRRRKTMKVKDFDPPADAPDYLKRNYHFQTDGYFSEESADFYEHQVEILFSGTAAPMRRMLIKAIKDKMGPRYRPLKILEIGAGVGSATIDFSKSFNFERYVVSDVSESYLSKAKERCDDDRLEFVQSPAEDLPFEDGSFDIVFSVFLFHELPRKVRDKVIQEANRVLGPGGIIGICDSLQKDDVPELNRVLEDFPKDYHEPFYKDYTMWNATEALENAKFKDISASHKLLSKYWVAMK